MSMTEAEVKTRIEGLPEQQARAVVCALVGHSRVQTACMGYFNCNRCDARLGDSLASSYPAAAQAVVVDHHCDVCRENVKTLLWKDTFLLPEKTQRYLKALRNVALSRRIAAQQARKLEEARAWLDARNYGIGSEPNDAP